MFRKFEIKRQSVHILTGLLLLLGLKTGLLNCFLIFCCFILVVIFAIIIKKGYRIPLFSIILDQLQRKYEKTGIPAQGLLFYLLGIALTCYLFPPHKVYAAILILAFGDSISRLIGPRGYISKPLQNKRFLLGIFGGGTVATLSAWLFVPLPQAFFASIVAMLIETHNIKIAGFRLDDNLLIPVFAGLIMLIVNAIF